MPTNDDLEVQPEAAIEAELESDDLATPTEVVDDPAETSLNPVPDQVSFAEVKDAVVPSEPRSYEEARIVEEENKNYVEDPPRSAIEEADKDTTPGPQKAAEVKRGSSNKTFDAPGGKEVKKG